jgi:phosphatidylserine decarboxylase
MHIYEKAFPLLVRIALFLLFANLILIGVFPASGMGLFLPAISVFLYLLIIAFCRVPLRTENHDETSVFSPADGTIVAIEQVFEDEFLHEPCKKIAVFMSLLNVHQNRAPVSGKVIYSRYHPGKYMVAWHPKSSLRNERFSTVIETIWGRKLLIRQIAGFVARRIICNFDEGDEIRQGDELGFILFGSRVDLFLPPETVITVKAGEKVKGGKSVLARLI